MSLVVERTRNKYRNERERGSYDIFSMEYSLRMYAWEGLIWCLKDMPDLTIAEQLLINYFLKEYEDNQVYDV